MPGRAAPHDAIRLWRVALAILVVTVCVLAFMPVPPRSLSTGWDKLNHTLAFATLAIAARNGFPARGAIAAVVLALLAFGGFIEIVQAFVPGRGSEWADLFADAIGIGVGVLALQLARRLRRAALSR